MALLLSVGAKYISAIFVTKNYTGALIEYGRKSDALNICMNKINEAKFKEFETLADLSGTEEVGSMIYSYDIEILPYKDSANSIADNVKIVVSTVTYSSNGNENSVSLRCLKVENN